VNNSGNNTLIDRKEYEKIFYSFIAFYIIVYSDIFSKLFYNPNASMFQKAGLDLDVFAIIL